MTIKGMNTGGLGQKLGQCTGKFFFSLDVLAAQMGSGMGRGNKNRQFTPLVSE
jgi:hypothetical protein